MRRLDAYALTLSLLLCCRAGAVTMHICTSESPMPPYTTAEGNGIADDLILRAAKEVGLTIKYHVAPLIRCEAEIRANVSDASPAAPYTQLNAEFCIFPMKGDEPDAKRATLAMRTLVFRRVGSKTEWNGIGFSELSTPVLTQSGMNMFRDRLIALNVRVDSSGKSVEANFTKMLAGRGDVAVMPEYSGLATMAQPSYAGKIEALPTPFTSQLHYLIVSKRFYEANSELVEKLWETIGRIRRSREQVAQQKTVRRP